MANTASNVAVGKPKTTGGVYAGAVAATLPHDPTTALDVSLTALGYLTEDGVTMTKGGNTTPIRAWGGDDVRTIKTTDELTFDFSFLETSVAVFKEVYGQSSVTTSAGDNTVTIDSAQLGNRAYVFEILDGATAFRILVPVCSVTSQSAVTFTSGEPIAFGVTLTAYPDASGNKAYIFHTLAA